MTVKSLLRIASLPTHVAGRALAAEALCGEARWVVSQQQRCPCSLPCGLINDAQDSAMATNQHVGTQVGHVSVHRVRLRIAAALRRLTHVCTVQRLLAMLPTFGPLLKMIIVCGRRLRTLSPSVERHHRSFVENRVQCPRLQLGLKTKHFAHTLLRS